MAYTGQHYDKEALVDPDLVAVGVTDPRTVNWLAELITVEATRLTTALFGADTLSQFHFLTKPQWPAKASTPALLCVLSNMAESPVFNPPKEVGITKEYGPSDAKTVSFNWPTMFDVSLEWTVAHNDEFPPFDLEQKLLNLCDDSTATIVNETIAFYRDTPTYQWEPSDSNVVGVACVVVYRNVPVVWGSRADYGAIISEITLAMFNKRSYDDFDVDEPLD